MLGFWVGLLRKDFLVPVKVITRKEREWSFLYIQVGKEQKFNQKSIKRFISRQHIWNFGLEILGILLFPDSFGKQ